MSKRGDLYRKALGLDDSKPRPRGRELDLELVAMIKARAAKATDPADGFVSAMHEHDRTLEIDGLMIYAWGPSAAVLAKNLGMTPSRTRRLVEPVDTAAPAIPSDWHTCPHCGEKCADWNTGGYCDRQKLLAAPPPPESEV